MNAPDRFELFVLPEGVKKLSYQKDTKLPNAGTFTIQKEDHTVGNIIRVQLLRSPELVFGGYKMPHPLEHSIIVKIQTTPSSSPAQALQDALTGLIAELNTLETRFSAEVDRRVNPSADYY